MLEPEGDVLGDRAPGEKREILEHEGDRVERVLRRRTLDRDRAGGRPQEAADDRQKRALAAARRADDDRDLVTGDLERDVVEDWRPAEVVAHPFDEEAHRQPSGGTNEVSTMSFTPKPLSTMPFDW